MELLFLAYEFKQLRNQLKSRLRQELTLIDATLAGLVRYFSLVIPGSAVTETLFSQKLACELSSSQHDVARAMPSSFPDRGVQWGPFRAGRRRLGSYQVTPYAKTVR